MATYTKDTLPWKLREGKPNHAGALSSEQIQRLSKDWDIAAEHLEAMSRNIDIGLSAELNLTQPNLRQPKREKGKREAETAIKKLASISNQMDAISKILNNLSFSDPYAYTGRKNFAQEYLLQFSKAASVACPHRVVRFDC